MSKYQRSLSELREKAVLHWPEEILEKAGDGSILPKLLETQDSFLSILGMANKSPNSWIDAINLNKEISGPLFIKHLMVLSDLGGESLNKIPPLSQYFPGGKMEFIFNDKSCVYNFKKIGDKCSLTNSALKMDTKSLLRTEEMSDKMIDVGFLLLFGSLCTNDDLPVDIKDKCVIGSLLGDCENLELYCKQNYIRVSKQVSGAKANSLGHLSEDYVRELLSVKLPKGWTVLSDAKMDGVTHSEEGSDTTFDIVVKSPEGSQTGIEVSFQVTTNSTIERKAREAQSLKNSVHKAGHKIAYVIDGAGNINIRKNAVSTLCENSDCTIAFSEEEVDTLVNFLKETSK